MPLQIAAIVASLFAALFAYLSWRKAVLTDVFEREEQLRSRLADPALGFVTGYYAIQVYRIRSVEREGWWYRLKKYSPVGEVDGRTQLTLLFMRGDGREIFQNEVYADQLESSGVHYIHSVDTTDVVGELEVDAEMGEGEDPGITLTLVIDSIDPKEVEDLLTVYRVALTEFLESKEEGNDQMISEEVEE